jgi:glycerol-3-phosphate cytidylyltransferase
VIVYTVGTFDLLHVGHLALLEYCKSLGNVLAVGVASDRVVNSYKPNVPVIPLEQRMEMLKALSCVDIVRSYDELEYVSGCKELKADIFVIGEDWGNQPYNVAVESYLLSRGKQIKKVRYNPRTSSTRIKQDVLAQNAHNDLIQSKPTGFDNLKKWTRIPSQLKADRDAPQVALERED